MFYANCYLIKKWSYFSKVVDIVKGQNDVNKVLEIGL